MVQAEDFSVKKSRTFKETRTEKKICIGYKALSEWVVEKNGKREKNNSEGEGLDLALLSNARQVGYDGP